MWDARPGMRVVCICEDFRRDEAGLTYPVLNQVLTIRDVFDAHPDGLLLRFIEIRNPRREYICGASIVTDEGAFGIEHFRPCRATDISAFKAHEVRPPGVFEQMDEHLSGMLADRP